MSEREKKQAHPGISTEKEQVKGKKTKKQMDREAVGTRERRRKKS